MTVLQEYRDAQQRLVARVRELEPLVAEYHELRAELERLNLTEPAAAKADTAPIKSRRQRRRRTAATSRSRSTTTPHRAPAAKPAKVAGQQPERSADANAKLPRRTSRTGSKKPGASRAPKGGRAEQIANLVAQNPGLTIKDLGTQLGVDPTGLYQPVRKLIAAGTIRKDGSQLHATK